jgi:hypothetical protein
MLSPLIHPIFAALKDFVKKKLLGGVAEFNKKTTLRLTPKVF